MHNHGYRDEFDVETQKGRKTPEDDNGIDFPDGNWAKGFNDRCGDKIIQSCIDCEPKQGCNIDCEIAEVSKSTVADGSTAEVEALKQLCKELLDGADKCSQEPHYIVQPFMGIVKRHAATITKHGLL